MLSVWDYLNSKTPSGAAINASVMPTAEAPLQPSYSQVSQKVVTSLPALAVAGQVLV